MWKDNALDVIATIQNIVITTWLQHEVHTFTIRMWKYSSQRDTTYIFAA